MTWIYRDDAACGSSREEICFVWKDEAQPIYLMDNHRAASWCWAQHLCPTDSYDLVHIDAHWDVGVLTEDELKATQTPGFWKKCLVEFLKERSPDDTSPAALIRYDNYIKPFVSHYANIGKCLLHARQHIGSGDEKALHPKVELFDGFSDFSEAAQRCRGQLILNVDIDYAFSQELDDVDEFYARRRLTSDALIQCGFEKIRSLLLEDRVIALTVALSPEFCGGEEAAFSVWELACTTLSIRNPISVVQGRFCFDS